MEKIIDTHIHLTDEEFQEDLPEVLEKCRQAGVAALIAQSITIEDAQNTLVLCRQYPQLCAAIGIHCHEAAKCTEQDMEMVRRLHTDPANEPYIVAVGEIGIDYHYNFASRAVQIKWLRRQLEIAKDLDRPIILHTRESDEDVIATLKEVWGPNASTIKGVVHCCNSGWQYAQRYLEMGLYLGVTGMVTFPKLIQVHAVAAQCPAERLLLETDGPYLAPVPHRGRRCDSSYLPIIAQRVAELRRQDYDLLLRQTTQNALRLFGPRLEECLNH